MHPCAINQTSVAVANQPSVSAACVRQLPQLLCSWFLYLQRVRISTTPGKLDLEVEVPFPCEVTIRGCFTPTPASRDLEVSLGPESIEQQPCLAACL